MSLQVCTGNLFELCRGWFHTLIPLFFRHAFVLHPARGLISDRLRH